MSNQAPVISTNGDWPIRPVGALVTLLRRGTAPDYVDESDVMAIGQRCVTDADFDGTRARPHSPAAMARTLRPQPDDVLINSTGTGTIGRSVVFRGRTTKFIVDGHITVARPRQSELVGRWLNDVLRTPECQRYLEARCYAGSTNQVELSSTALAAMPIALPPVDEQRRIAEIMDTLDKQIAATKQIVSKLGSVQVGLMRSLLGSGHVGAPTVAGNRDVMVPKGWRSAPLAEIVGAPITYGIVQAGPHVPGGIPYVRTGDMSGDRLAVEGMLRTSRRIANDYARSTVHTGELVCAIRATVGKVLVVPPELDGGNLTQGTARIAPGRSIDPRFLYWEMCGERVQRQIALAIKGTTFFEITLAALRRIRVAMPDLKEQRNIAEVLDANDSLLGRERDFLAHLKMLKAGLMSDLLTGRVRVPLEAVL
jgi:type I restriction enzyme, S subunit